jgi:type VI secretion system secreted protein Hcp
VATDFFLKIAGIEGESLDVKLKGAIELESFTWGATNEGGHSVGGGGGAGKVAIQDFHFVTRVSKASPTLFLSCATGKHLKEAVLTGRKAGKDLQDYLILKFTDLLVSSYQIGGAEGMDAPMDQVSFKFARVQFEYRFQKPDGSLGPPVKAGWDVIKNKSI